MAASPQPLDPWGQMVEEQIRQARTGSQAALGALLEAFRLLLLSEAVAQLSSELLPKEGVSDVVQETFTDAVRDFSSFHGTAAPQLKRWLLTILGHNVANLRRKYYDTAKSQIDRECRLAPGDTSDLGVDEPCDRSPSPSSIVSQKEEEEFLRQALQRLEPENRYVIQLRHVEGLGFPTIGVQLGISEEAARKRFSRAIERLSQRIDEVKAERKAQCMHLWMPSEQA